MAETHTFHMISQIRVSPTLMLVEVQGQLASICCSLHERNLRLQQQIDDLEAAAKLDAAQNLSEAV